MPKTKKNNITTLGLFARIRQW